MDSNNLYKMFQITDILVNKYKYTQVILKQYQDMMSQEAWLFNSENENYQAIRVTFSSASQYLYETTRINDYISLFEKTTGYKEIRMLDIHINNEKYDADNEDCDYCNIDLNYFDGYDISNVFPELKNAIHIVEDQNKEINSIVDRMKKSIKERVKKVPFSIRYPQYVTNIITAVCIVLYIISLILKIKYNDDAAVLIFLGAEYKTFTIGLKQFYRLFTYGFLHANLIHLVFNMISLNTIGRYCEMKYGHLKYFIILSISIICGALTQGILYQNEVCIGLSGGIYGLFIIYLIDIVKKKLVSFSSLLPTLIINLALNFLSITAWMCHLGGAIAGYILYRIIEDEYDWKKVSLLALLMISLTYKYFSIKYIDYLYTGTDMNVVKIIYDFGLKDYANKCMIKILEFYSKMGV